MYCTDEGNYCGPFDGTRDVAYGIYGKFAFQWGITSGIPCTNEAFNNDPYYGIHKYCWTKYSGTGATVSELPAEYRANHCATEGAPCSFSGTKDIAYGAGTRYLFRYGVAGGMPCTNEAFGDDPYYGTHKDCYTATPGGPSSPSGGGGISQDFVTCATEGEYCALGNGAKDVSYGSGGTWGYRYNLNVGVDCSNEALGDPVPGRRKECRIKPTAGGPHAGQDLTVKHQHVWVDTGFVNQYGGMEWPHKIAVLIEAENELFADVGVKYVLDRSSYDSAFDTNDMNQAFTILERNWRFEQENVAGASRHHTLFAYRDFAGSDLGMGNQPSYSTGGRVVPMLALAQLAPDPSHAWGPATDEMRVFLATHEHGHNINGDHEPTAESWDEYPGGTLHRHREIMYTSAWYHWHDYFGVANTCRLRNYDGDGC